MKKLTRSRNNKYIFGVCGGLAEYLNIDSTIVRLLWFVLTMTSFGIFGVAYLVCGLVIPFENFDVDGYKHETSNKNTNIIIGLSLIVVGIYMISNLLFPHLSISLYRLIKYWPVLLIVLGLYIITKKD